VSTVKLLVFLYKSKLVLSEDAGGNAMFLRFLVGLSSLHGLRGGLGRLVSHAAKLRRNDAGLLESWIKHNESKACRLPKRKFIALLEGATHVSSAAIDGACSCGEIERIFFLEGIIGHPDVNQFYNQICAVQLSILQKVWRKP
jgi:hypothetical protein